MNVFKMDIQSGFHAVSYLSFAISVSANFLLIFLLLTTTSTKLGSSDVIYQPIVLAQKGGYMSFSSGPLTGTIYGEHVAGSNNFFRVESSLQLSSVPTFRLQ